jgi:hypothetical protein
VRNNQHQLKQQQYRYIDDKFGKEEMEGSLKYLNIIHLDRKLPRETKAGYHFWTYCQQINQVANKGTQYIGNLCMWIVAFNVKSHHHPSQTDAILITQISGVNTV